MENVKAKAEVLKGNKAMAWGLLAVGGVFLMAAASGDAAAVGNETATASTIYYGMTIFEWVLAALTVILIVVGLYLKNFWALIFGMVVLIILAISYLGV